MGKIILNLPPFWISNNELQEQEFKNEKKNTNKHSSVPEYCDMTLSFPAFGKKGGSFKIVIFPVQYSILYTDPDSKENIFRKLLNWGDSKNSIYCNVLPFLAEPSCILTLYYLQLYKLCLHLLLQSVLQIQTLPQHLHSKFRQVYL